MNKWWISKVWSLYGPEDLFEELSRLEREGYEIVSILPMIGTKGYEVFARKPDVKKKPPQVSHEYPCDCGSC
jgi:hypothetical protein